MKPIQLCFNSVEDVEHFVHTMRTYRVRGKILSPDKVSFPLTCFMALLTLIGKGTLTLCIEEYTAEYQSALNEISYLF